MDSSGWDEDFVLEFSTDDEGSNTADQTDDVEDKQKILQDSKNAVISTKINHYAQMDLDNNYDDLKNNIKKQEHDMSNEESKRNFLSEYLIFPEYSPKIIKKRDLDLKKEDICNKIIDFSKLVNQLFNARVVIERLRENHKRNEQSEKKYISSTRKRILDSVQRYCPECKTIEVDLQNFDTKKSCLKCNTSLLYHCPKCNNKTYTAVRTLRAHYKTCEGNYDLSTAIIDSPVPVRKTKRELSRSFIRCSSCKEIIPNNENSKATICKKCEPNWLHQCRKCKKQFNSRAELSCHRKENCSPDHQYKCNKCDKSYDTQRSLSIHTTRMHSDTAEKPHCSKCDKYFKNRLSFKSHWYYCYRK